MQIAIEGTIRVENLVARNENGIEFTADLIEAGNLSHLDDGTPVMSQADFDWWTEYIVNDQLTKANARKLADDTGMDYADIMMEISKAQANTDMDGHRNAAIIVLDSYRS